MKTKSLLSAAALAALLENTHSNDRFPMKNRPHSQHALRLRSAVRLSFLLCLALLAGHLAQAANYTWSSSSNATFGNATNWTPSATFNTDDLFQFNSASYAPAPSVTGNLGIGGLQFTANNTGGITFGAGTSTLTLSGIDGVGILVDSGSGAVSTGSAKFALAGNQSWTNNSASLLTVGGTITNSGNATACTLTLNGTGAGGTTLSGIISNGGTVGTTAVVINTGGGNTTLSGANTFTGGVNLTAGTLVVDHNAALGTGAVTLAGGTIRTAGTSRSASNAVSITGDTTFGATGAAGILTLSGAASTTGDRSLTFNNTTSVLSGLLTLGGNLATSGTGGATFSGGIALGGANRSVTGNTSGTTTLTGALSSSSAGNKLVLSGAAVAVNNLLTGANTPGLEINGAGNYTITGTNTFTGPVTLTSGRLNLNSSTALGAATSFTINGGSIDQTISPQGIGGAVPITIGGDFTYVGTSNLNLGTGAITNAGNRTITLNGTNDILTMNGVMTNTSSANQTTTVNGAGNTFAIAGYALSNSATSYNNVINGSGNVTISGTVTNGGSATASSLAYAGTGTLSLTANNTFSGGLMVNSGTVITTALQSLGTGNVTLGSVSGGSAMLTWGNSAGPITNTLNVVGNGTEVRTLRLTGSGNVAWTGNITLGNNLVVDTGTNRGFTLGVLGGGQITGDYKISFTNSNGLAGIATSLAGQTSFSNTLEVTSGATLTLGGTGAGSVNLPNATVNLLSGGNLTVSQTATIGGITGVSDSGVSAGLIRTLILAGGGDYDYAGVIAGSASLSKTGAGNQTLSGANTYTGSTTVSGGTLLLSGVNTTTGNITINNGGTLVAGNVQALGNAASAIVNFNAGGILNLATDSSIGAYNVSTGNLNQGTMTILSDRATSGNGITQTLGTLSLNNGIVNITKGANVAGGSPSVAFGAVTLTNTGGVTATFNPTTASVSMTSVNGTPTNTNSQTMILDGTAAGNTITGVISNVGGGAGTGKIALTKSNTSIWTLSGANTYTGNTTVSGGILTFLNTTAKSSGSPVSATASGTIGLGVSGTNAYTSADVDSLFANTLTGFTMNAASGVAIDTSGGNFTYATNQSAARALTKLGANTLTLTGANTYNGGTIINAGTLLVNNTSGSGTGAGAVTVNSGGTLGGNGSISGAVTINSGGTIAPGNSPGVLTVNSLTLNSGSTTAFEINGITTAGTDYDKMVVNSGGGLTLNGAFTINFGNVSALSNATDINLISFTGGHTGDFTTVSSTGFYTGASWTRGVGDVWTLSSGGQTLTFAEATGNLNVVPEPATWLLLGLGLTTVLVFRRRKQS